MIREHQYRAQKLMLDAQAPDAGPRAGIVSSSVAMLAASRPMLFFSDGGPRPAPPSPPTLGSAAAKPWRSSTP